MVQNLYMYCVILYSNVSYVHVRVFVCLCVCVSGVWCGLVCVVVSQNRLCSNIRCCVWFSRDLSSITKKNIEIVQFKMTQHKVEQRPTRIRYLRRSRRGCIGFSAKHASNGLADATSLVVAPSKRIVRTAGRCLHWCCCREGRIGGAKRCLLLRGTGAAAGEL